MKTGHDWVHGKADPEMDLSRWWVCTKCGVRAHRLNYKEMPPPNLYTEFASCDYLDCDDILVRKIHES